MAVPWPPARELFGFGALYWDDVAGLVCLWWMMPRWFRNSSQKNVTVTP